MKVSYHKNLLDLVPEVMTSSYSNFAYFETVLAYFSLTRFSKTTTVITKSSRDIMTSQAKKDSRDSALDFAYDKSIRKILGTNLRFFVSEVIENALYAILISFCLILSGCDKFAPNFVNFAGQNCTILVSHSDCLQNILNALNKKSEFRSSHNR